MHWAGKELIAFNQIKDFNIFFTFKEILAANVPCDFG